MLVRKHTYKHAHTNYTKNNFSQSTTTRSSLRVTRELEALAPNLLVRASRETLSFRATTVRGAVGPLLDVLGDVLQPALRHWEVNDARDFVTRQADAARGDDRNAALELLHARAFRYRSLGRPLVLARGAGDVSLAALQQHVADCYTAPRVVVVLNGCDKSEAQQLAHAAFKGLKKTNVATPPPSAYVGGHARLELSGGTTHIVLAHSAAKLSPALRAIVVALLGRDVGPLDAHRQVGGGARLGKIGDEVHAAHSFVACARSPGAALIGVDAVALDGKSAKAMQAVRAVFAGLANVDAAALRGAQRRAIVELSEQFAGGAIVSTLATRVYGGESFFFLFCEILIDFNFYFAHRCVDVVAQGID